MLESLVFEVESMATSIFMQILLPIFTDTFVVCNLLVCNLKTVNKLLVNASGNNFLLLLVVVSIIWNE